MRVISRCDVCYLPIKLSLTVSPYHTNFRIPNKFHFQLSKCEGFTNEAEHERRGYHGEITHDTNVVKLHTSYALLPCHALRRKPTYYYYYYYYLRRKTYILLLLLSYGIM